MRIFTLSLLAFTAPALLSANPTYPVERPRRKIPADSGGSYTIVPGAPLQVIKGIGFEIQSDSIGSGNAGLPEKTNNALSDLIPSERERFHSEMLKGFRYCRLAGGLYWRGVDAEQKNLTGRWPTQMAELREMVGKSGIEGVSFEYWSPAPYWKANRAFHNPPGQPKGENMLRCFGKQFGTDPVYQGDTHRFLDDFSSAVCKDISTLNDNGIPVVIWGLQNEPFSSGTYSSCAYNPAQYAITFPKVAAAVRKLDPKIQIIADTEGSLDFSWIRPVLQKPEQAHLVDALVVHHIGTDSNILLNLPAEPSQKPRYQNEYEYLDGKTSPARCLNTVQHIMNWFQLGRAPTWFWIHALKPVGNSEAAGYSLGFWTPPDAPEDLPPIIPGTSIATPRKGHWTFNPNNWNAVGSFIRHLPWDSSAVTVHEAKQDPDLRIFAFTKKSDGKLTIVLSNRSFAPHTFNIDTGLQGGTTFKGWRYTPADSGINCQGVEISNLRGNKISPTLPDLSWEFWEEQ